LLFAKAGIDPGEIARQRSPIDRNNRVRRWLHRRGSTRKSSASIVALTGKFLAVTDQRQGARVVGKCRGRILLNLRDSFVKASLVVELGRSREGKALLLGIRGSFRQNFGGFIESTLQLEGRCFRTERGRVPGCQFQRAINDRPCFIEATDALECFSKG